MTSHYYRPSGRVPASAYPFVVLYALATIPVAWLYAWLMIHVPPVINLFFTVCYSVWLGYLTSRAGARAKVRNPDWMARAGIVIGLAGWYFQWAAWIALIDHKVAGQPGGYPLSGIFIDLASHPAVLFDAAIDIAQAGTWSLRGDPISGSTLALLWLGELLILLTCVRTSGRMQAGDPFCEASGTWAEKIEVTRKFAFVDDAQSLPAYLEQHPHDLLGVLGPWSETVSLSHATVTIHRCRGADSYLSLSNVAATMEKGKVKETITPVLMYLRLRGIDLDAFLEQLTSAMRSPTKAGSNEENAAPIAKELEAALDHLNTAHFEAALDGALRYTVSDQPSLRTDANRLCGLACSRLERWEAAFGFWHSLCVDEPTAHNTLQAATSSVMARNLERGILLMERACTLNASSREVPGITLETSFLTALTQAGQMQAGMPYLERIKQIYVGLGKTDPTVLFLYRLPRFDVFLDNSVPIVRANLDAEQERLWYASMLPHLDEQGKAELGVWMQAQLQPG